MNIDKDLAEELKDYARQLQSDNAERDVNLQKIDEAYLLNWKPPTNKYAKATLIQSPDFRNTMNGMIRLIEATDPQFKVVYPKGDYEDLESAIQRMWEVAGKIAGNPVHFDLTTSSILYAEMHAAASSTKSLVTRAKQMYQRDKRYKGEVAYAEELHATLPYLIDVWHPYGCYPEFDTFGRLSAYTRTIETTAYQLMQTFGADMPAETEKRKRSEAMHLHIFYDRTYFYAWCEDGDIQLEEHGKPIIPISVSYTEGSRLWKKPHEQRQPIGLTLLKSGIWNMENLIMTVIYTNIRDMGVTPLYVHTKPAGQEGKVNMDFDTAPGVVELVQGETFVPVQNKGLIDPSVSAGLDLAQKMSQDSTIYPQALGQPMASATTFSEYALAASAGRLPLTGPQKRGAWGISNIVQMVLNLWRSEAGSYNSNGIQLKRADIPKFLQVDTRLEVALPQDKLSLANIGLQLKQLGFSNEWIQNNIVGVENTVEMWEQQHSETVSEAEFMQYVQQQIAALATQGNGGAGGPPPGPGGQTPPMGNPANGQAIPEITSGPMAPEGGAQMQGGLPPAQAGLVPGVGQGQAAGKPGGNPNGQ